MPLETIPALKPSNPLSQSFRSRHGAVKPIATLPSPKLCLKAEGSPLNKLHSALAPIHRLWRCFVRTNRDRFVQGAVAMY